jgi:hypothetical protein
MSDFSAALADLLEQVNKPTGRSAVHTAEVDARLGSQILSRPTLALDAAGVRYTAETRVGVMSRSDLTGGVPPSAARARPTVIIIIVFDDGSILVIVAT